ncbi:hypothetical protein AWC38_SpisGene10914 [Stylophora pistillata]|uniref:Uncharacterized protein n=1 Tax=Stylophora pistillata TaxID=50429 RepID=A0A2B4S3L4_STYPI|nr:hypothetical protein AWC38_SpisGene10914 [Stylophora pistillata]
MSTRGPREETSGIWRAVVKACKFDFENGLDDWEKTGTAFNNQPTYGDNPTARNRGQPAKQKGDWWIGGAENRPSNASQAGLMQGDSPQGTITSPPFEITGNNISFLIGGGCDINSVRAELIVNNKVVRKETGKCHETMTRQFWFVEDFIGQHAQLKLVDFSSGGWGHINFDDLKGDITCLKVKNFASCKFDFENGIDGWQRTGSAFNNQPTYGDNPTARGRGQPANQQGNWWIGGYEDRPSRWATEGQVQKDTPQGTLTSPPFDIQGNYISFLIGGGCDINTVYAELIVNHKVVRKTTGKCHETMTRQFWYVGHFIGQRAQLKLVDFNSGGWGHINFDDLKGDIACSNVENTGFNERGLMTHTINTGISKVESCVFDFEEGIDGWHRTGLAFDNQPTYGDNPTARRRGQPANQQGEWWIGGCEGRPSKWAPAGRTQGDGPQGTLTTPSFIIGGKYVSFLIGGGCDINSVRAELIIDHKVVRKSTGKCHETMTRNFWEVGDFIGRTAQVKLVDFSSGGWGHINFDDLRGDITCSAPENNDIFGKSFCKFDFEDGLDGWVRTGTVFDNQPTYGDNPTVRNRGQPANQHGDWWIGGYEDRPSKWATAGRVQLDEPQGTLTSPPFDIQGDYISFLIGGGCDINTVRAELIVDERVVRNATGNCHETMTRKSWFVGDLFHHLAQVRLVDFSSGGWGHINFDDMKGNIICTGSNDDTDHFA